MAAQSIASRPRRQQQQTEPDDAVLARALEFAEWSRKHATLVVVIAVAAVVLAGGLFWYRADQARRTDEAAVAFLQVEQAVYSGDESIAMRDLQLYIQQHGGTSYADEARVLLGQVHLRAGRPAEAIETLRPVADRMDRSPVGAQASILTAKAHEVAGQPQEAIAAYLRVADRSGSPFRQREALEGAAILRQEQGDAAGAAELYRRLLETTEAGTMERSVYEMRLAEAEAQAAGQ